MSIKMTGKRLKPIYNTLFIVKPLRFWPILGIILGIVGFLGIEISSRVTLCNFKTIDKFCETKIDSLKKRGNDIQRQQLENLKRKKSKRSQKLNQMRKRLEGLKEIYSNKEHQAFYQINDSIIKDLNDKINQMKQKEEVLKSITLGSTFGLFILTMGWTFIIFYVTYLIIRHAQKISIIGIHIKYNYLKKVYWLPVLLLSTIYLSRDVYTSFFLIAPNSYSWVSFCISKVNWFFMKLLYIGGILIAAYTFTVGYILSSKELEPPIDLDAHDTKCGVGEYVLFLQTWSIIGLTVVLFPVLFWVNKLSKDYDEDLDKIYLIDLIGFAILVMIIVSRFIIRAISLKLKYYEKIKNLRLTYREIVEKSLPPDPTIGFLGEHWWSLPASIIAIAAALWFLIKYLSLEELLLGSIK